MGKEDSVGTANQAETQSLSVRFLEEMASRNPSEVIIAWDKSGRLGKILPEVVALKGVEQRPNYHLEGDVLTHTVMVLGHLPSDASLDLRLAALFHDIGKSETTKIDLENGKISSHHHQVVGAEIAGGIIDRFSLNCPQTPLNKEEIVWLVKYHLIGQGAGGEVLREANVRKFFLTPDGRQMSDWGKDLLALLKADSLGREQVGEKRKLATFDATLARIEEMIARNTSEQTPPPPIPNGNRIMKLFALEPGPVVGQIKNALERMYEELGFPDQIAGERAAILLLSSLGAIKPGTKQIPPEVLDQAVEEAISFFRQEDSERRFGQQTISVLTSGEKNRIIKKEVQGEWRRYQLNEAEAVFLKNKRVRILVIGSPRATIPFTHALAACLEESTRKLAFTLAIQKVFLKGEAILAQSRGQLTRPQIQEAERKFKLQGGNVVLVDCPGEEQDELMRVIAHSADCAILVASGENDTIYSSRTKLYKDFLRTQRVPLVAEYRLRPKGQIKDSTGEEIYSETRMFVPERFIGGQIVGLQVGEENSGPVINDAAKALLFSILPRLCRGQRYIETI